MMDLDCLTKDYTACDWSSVQKYLKENQNILDVLLEASTVLDKYFGNGCHKTLEMVSDPEAEDEPVLFVYVHTALSVDEALSRMDRFDRDWFLGKLDRTNGSFNVNLAFEGTA